MLQYIVFLLIIIRIAMKAKTKRKLKRCLCLLIFTGIASMLIMSSYKARIAQPSQTIQSLDIHFERDARCEEDNGIFHNGNCVKCGKSIYDTGYLAPLGKHIPISENFQSKTEFLRQYNEEKNLKAASKLTYVLLAVYIVLGTLLVLKIRKVGA